MKPELHVTLNVHAMGSEQKLKSDVYLLLRKAFRARLVDFAVAQPEGSEIPKATVPWPFNNKPEQGMLYTNKIHPFNFSSTNEKSALSTQQLVPASHLSQSFRRVFFRNGLQAMKQ
ncbi:hypothetical protein POM88_022695 [Heracleum sosnowskyi]|uniref:Uncharacterized protein n=1 Tax=Heracleum sosnowskyi TaxID=360622 RepID=A0AAD8MPV6_9APIA|nr:hypothetical protein POM88_022695 [Heracleum sosnowskyi]